MKKKGITKIISAVSMILCLVIAFGSVSFAIESNNNFLSVDSISICERHGIVEGESVQLTAALTPESAVSSDVKWEVGDKNIISFDDKTGQVIGLKPGVTTITATADGVKQTCTVHSLYYWPQTWTTQTNRNTNLYQAVGAEYKTDKAMLEGKKFIVYGDEGGSEGWAYGNISGTDSWGYVPISHISTKNTISYYNSLGWLWPLEDTNIKHISSTYGPRSTSVGSSNHRGIDVTTGIPGEISGEPLVAPFDGVVKKAGYDDSCGYYICITSDEPDPVTGYKIIAIYMHMESPALYTDTKRVKKGESIVGYVGTTGDSSGYHLHMEANNRNAAVGDSYRTTYTYTINPLYFYMDVTPTFSNNSAYINHGGYWYNENA